MNNKTTFGLPPQVIDKLCTLFRNYNDIDQVFFYRSRAIGNYKLGSDIDLCIDAETMDVTDLFKIENQIDDLLLPWKIDLCLKGKIDNPNLLEHIMNVGVIVYSSKAQP